MHLQSYTQSYTFLPDFTVGEVSIRGDVVLPNEVYLMKYTTIVCFTKSTAGTFFAISRAFSEIPSGTFCKTYDLSTLYSKD